MQKKLFPLPPNVHGAAFHEGKRKRLRPLSTKAPLHLILKAERDFDDKAAFVLAKALDLAKRFELLVLDQAINHDHLHLVLKVPHRSRYNAFIRALTGVLARRIGKGIWQTSPFTRVAGWGKELRALEKYLEMNRFEAEGIMPKQPRTDFYAKWRPKRD
jgi:hypothetical protein